MMSIVLTGLEAVINKVLRLDPDTIERLKKLDGKSVKVMISDWNISFFVLPYAYGLQLLSEYDKQLNTVISGKLFSLMKAGAAKAQTTALFDESITISGDTQTGEAIRDVLKNLDIDWEEQLSKIVGDSFAHPIAYHAKKAVGLGKQTIKSLGENVAEYLHYESQQLPPEQAVENFITNVGRLRDDVDRLEARINQLMIEKPER